MKKYSAYIVSNRFVSPTVLELSLARSNGNLFPEFLPGQYATLSFPLHQKLRGERSFSIASSPTDRSVLRFGIKVFGRYTNALKDLRPGDPVMVRGPFGQFIFDQVRDQSAVFLAGGIGITPFVSMIRWATNKKLLNDLTLIYSVKSLSDAPYREDFLAMAMQNPHLRVIFVVSDEKQAQPEMGIYPGRITGEIINQVLNNQLLSRTFLICGPPPFMDTMFKILDTFQVKKDFIYSEKFGIGSKAFIESHSPMPKVAFAAWGLAAAVVFGIVVKMEQAKRSNAATENFLNQNSAITNVVPSNNANLNTNLNQANQQVPSVTNGSTTNQTNNNQVNTYTPPPVQYTPVMPRTRMS